MRLVFICSGLEPGRDGVGDFARTLAQECAKLGHEVRLAAVRDAAGSGKASIDGREFRAKDIFRNPVEAREMSIWLRNFNPDWASVQYTPFGFHPRGLGSKRASWLRELLPTTTRRHIMLHEIWLQPGRDGTFRHRALGWAQRRSVDAWIHTGWNPEIVQTQSRLHQVRLQTRGVKVDLLPLCSTFRPVSIAQSAARASVADWLRAAGQTVDENAFWFGHFGAFHAQAWDFTDFAQNVTVQLKASGKRACFLALGRAAAVGKVFADAAHAVPDADFRVVGELSEEKVPVAMQACDGAFTSTPWDIIEKSSAVAAWRALGVPVWVTRAGATDSTQLPAWPDSGLILADINSVWHLPKYPSRIAGPLHLDPAQTAQTFLATLATPPHA